MTDVQPKTLKECYQSLPANIQINVRDRIISECEIQVDTFYKYTNQVSKPMKLIATKITEIMTEYFPEITREALFPLLKENGHESKD